MYLFIYLYIYLFIYLSVYLFICGHAYLYVNLKFLSWTPKKSAKPNLGLTQQKCWCFTVYRVGHSIFLGPRRFIDSPGATSSAKNLDGDSDCQTHGHFLAEITTGDTSTTNLVFKKRTWQWKMYEDVKRCTRS